MCIIVKFPTLFKFLIFFIQTASVKRRLLWL